MLSPFATFSWYVFLAMVVFALQRMTRCFTNFNVYTLFAGFLLLRHGVTVPFDNNVNEWFAGITLSPPTRPRFYTALVLTYVSLLLGIFAARFIVGRAIVRRKMPRLRSASGINVLLFTAVLLVSLILVVKFELLASTFNVREFLTGGMTASEYAESRLKAGEAVHYSAGPWQRLASISYFGIFPLLTYISYFLQRQNRAWRPVLFTVLLVGVVNGLKSGQKSPALFLLAGLAVCWYVGRGRRSLKIGDWRLWLGLGLGTFVVMPYLYQIQYPAFTYGRAVKATWYRLSSEYNRGLQLYFEIYPGIHPFMHGKSSGLLNTVRGIAVPLDDLPERFVAIHYLGPTYQNTWNASFIGTAWADFGYGGVIIESVMLAFVLQYYARWFSRVRPTALALGTEVALAMAATKTSEVPLTASVFSFGLISGFVVYLLLRIEVVQSMFGRVSTARLRRYRCSRPVPGISAAARCVFEVRRLPYER